jgi:hypothetical protein
MKIESVRKSFIFEDERPCHASTVLSLSDGGLLAAWFGGTCEGDPDVDIWLARCEHGLWSAPVKIAEEDGLPHWNPVLFQSPDGTVHLFYKVGHTIPYWYTGSFDPAITAARGPRRDDWWITTSAAEARFEINRSCCATAHGQRLPLWKSAIGTLLSIFPRIRE